MQKDQTVSLDDAKDKLKQAGVTEDEMAALERQLAPAANGTPARDSNRKVGFVSAGTESQPNAGIRSTANAEDIDLPEESDSEEDDERVEIKQKDVPDAVFGELAQKRKDAEDGDDTKDNDSRLGALERIKRQKRG